MDDDLELEDSKRPTLEDEVMAWLDLDDSEEVDKRTYPAGPPPSSRRDVS